MGGNVGFGDQYADRIDLTKVPRQEIVKSLTVSLLLLNDQFKKQTGFTLWKGNLSKYLSGSTTAMFDKKIDDKAFTAVKPSVGDIDIRVNGLHEKEIVALLSSVKGKKIGDLRLIDFKKSTDQYITLWQSIKYKINIQVDLEMVDFDSRGNPTPWSGFSRSSAWADMSLGIKGVAHKYVFRALTAVTLHDLIIRPRTARSKEKRVTATIDSFSLKGWRQRLQPALDDNGKHIYKDGLPVYDELQAKDTGTITDLKMLFEIIFKKTPTKAELGEGGLGSFVGVIGLIHKYTPKNEWTSIADGFANLLWGPKAQNMYRDDNDRDLKEKRAMIETMADKLGINKNRWDKMIKGYYK